MAPPRPEKIEQKRARELTKVIQLSPNTAAGGFRAQTRRASFAGRPPTPRRRFWRAPAPRLNLRGGMVVQIRARQTRRRTAGSPCSQRRKAKRQSAQAGRRVRRGRDRRRTLRGVQNGDTTASRSDPKGAELTLCPAPRGAQGSAGGTQRSRAPVRAAFGRGSGGAHAANTEPLCSQRRKKFRASAQAGQRDRRGGDRRRTLRARRTETRPPAAVTRKARN